MRGRTLPSVLISALALAACASEPTPPPATPAAAQAAPAASSGTAPALRGGASISGTAPALRGGASISGTAPALRGGASIVAPAPAPPPALAGRWVEFWALSGAADTQCYAFFDDGRFGWHAAASSAEPQSRRWGHYRLAPGALVLQVEGQEQRAGCSGDACRVALTTPLEEQLPLGDCPANEEAKNLDPAYVCLAIAGHAFWRDTHAAPDPAAFIP